MGYGLETEIPMRLPHLNGLQFYFEKQIVANGYAWIFPCGESVRIGVVSFAPGVKLRPRLEEFLDRFDLQIGDTHGGVLAVERSAPTVRGVFCVGDAAGQCLPVTGEGIRTAIFHGIHCGRAIANALHGRLTPNEAFALYRDQVSSMNRFHARLLHLQMLVARTPEWLLAWGGRICSAPPLTQAIMDRYLVNSGWLVGNTL